MNQKFDAPKFSKALKTKRVIECDAGLREAAELIGISSSTLSRIENNKEAELSSVLKISNWLHIPLSDFIVNIPTKRSKRKEVKQ